MNGIINHPEVVMTSQVRIPAIVTGISGIVTGDSVFS
jgi:hypothetical protein